MLVALLILIGQGFAQTVVATISTPQPLAVAVNPLTRLVYAANFNQPVLSIISEETNSVVDTVTFPSGAGGNQAELDGVAVNPLTSRLYVADTHNTILYVLDTRNNQIIATVPGLSGALAVNIRTNKIYVSEFGSTVAIVDGDTNHVTATVSVPFPAKAAVDLFANRVYVPSENFFGDVFVLDGNTNAVLAEIPTGNFTAGVAVDFLHHLAYAANQGFSDTTSSLSVIDTNTNTVIATLATDSFPTFVEVNPFTDQIFVINQVPNNATTPTVVDVIDGHTRQIVNRVSVLSTPEDSALDLIHGRLFIASSDFEGGVADAVTVINTRNNN